MVLSVTQRYWKLSVFDLKVLWAFKLMPLSWAVLWMLRQKEICVIVSLQKGLDRKYQNNTTWNKNELNNLLRIHWRTGINSVYVQIIHICTTAPRDTPDLLCLSLYYVFKSIFVICLDLTKSQSSVESPGHCDLLT